jgi:hypothetical protein
VFKAATDIWLRRATRGSNASRAEFGPLEFCEFGEVERIIAERERPIRRKLVLWLVLLIAGFLAGFILQYAKLQRVQEELLASTKQLGSCRSSEQLSLLRDTATMMYLEAVQKNYGKAGEYSKEVFDQAHRIAGSTEDPALRNLLRDILAAIRSPRIRRRQTLPRFQKYSLSYPSSSRLRNIDESGPWHVLRETWS